MWEKIIELGKEMNIDSKDWRFCFAAPADFLVASMHAAYSHDQHFKKIRPFQNFNNFLGMLVVDVFDSSLEVLKTSKESIQFFRPNIGVVVYNEREKKERINKIEKLLGNGYEKVYEGKHELDPDASCLIYQSLRRKNE